jgi:hypothetical protein
MGNSKYNYNKNKYSIKRVDRMVKNMTNKNMSYKEALFKEQKRLAKIRTAKTLGIIGGLTLGYVDLATNGRIHKGAAQLIKNGKDTVSSVLNNHAKSMIIDSNGKVIKRYYLKSLAKSISYSSKLLK